MWSTLERLGRRVLAWRDGRRFGRALESDAQTYLDKLVWSGISTNGSPRDAHLGPDGIGIGQWLAADLNGLPTDQLDYIEVRTRHESEIAVDKLRDGMILRRSKIEGALERRTDAQTELDQLTQLPLEAPGDAEIVTRRFEAEHELLGHRSRIEAPRRSGVSFLLLAFVVLVFEAILVFMTLSPVFEDTVSHYFVAVATISCSIGMLVLAHVGFFVRGKIARFAGRSGLLAISIVLATVRVGVISNDVRVDATSLALEVAFFLTMIAIAWLGARFAFEALKRLRTAERMERLTGRRTETLRAFLDATNEHQRQRKAFTSARTSRADSRGAHLRREVTANEVEFHREEAAARRLIQTQLQDSIQRLRPILRNTAKQLARQKYGLTSTAMTEDANAKSNTVVDLVRQRLQLGEPRDTNRP